MLLHGRISYVWANILFWRAFLAMTLHYVAILMIGSMSLKLGIITNENIDTKMGGLSDRDRPDADTATMFSFVKQQFYHRTLAYTKYEKNKLEKG